MKISVVQGNILEHPTDALIVNLFEGVTTPDGATGAVDRALDGAISEMITSGDLSGKQGEVGVVYPRGAIPARRILVVGLGKKEDFNLEVVRCSSAAAIKHARELNSLDAATIVHGPATGGLHIIEATQATLEGALLGLYRYDALKHNDEPKREIQSLTFVEYDAGKVAEIESGVKFAEAIVTGVYLTRDLVNMPSNLATPSKLAAIAEEIATTHGMTLTLGDREWAAKRGMGAYLSVAKGAGESPKFIILEHNGQRDDLDTIVLVGKGITFDSGGISLKPGERMEEMKSDMAGAAVILGAMKIVGLMDLPLRVIGIAPCTENMPDAAASHPGDVITASNGKNIEIINTDAEGRLVLADALVYARQYKPKAVIDLATLTGACVTALGEGIAAGLFCTDDWLRERLVLSGENTHERLWPMPLWDDYKKKIKSNVADIKNSGGRFGGVGTSAIFLKEFTDYSWAHIDIAPMALLDKKDESPYIPAGGSGFGVRLLVEFLRDWQPRTSSL
jgi:leucyl aminopeptidase